MKIYLRLIDTKILCFSIYYLVNIFIDLCDSINLIAIFALKHAGI